MAKKSAKKRKKGKYDLPKPVFPKLGMPESPEAGRPKQEPHFSCDGEHYQPVDMSKSEVKPPAEGVGRILIGIPVLTYSNEFVQSFLRFWTQVCNASLEKDKVKYEAGYYFVHRKPVHMADQMIVDIALYNKCTHVLFIDDDITGITKGMLDKLYEADKDVIAGVMYASKFPHAMCVFRRYDTSKKVIDMPADNSMFRLYEVPSKCIHCDFPVQGFSENFHCPKCGKHQSNCVQKADLVPFCFTLMKTSIFAKMRKPWFHCTLDYPADSWFSDRCIEAGVQQYGHMAVRLTHAGVNDYNRQHHFQIGLTENQRLNKGLIPLSQEDMKKHEFMLNEKMKEAELQLKYGTTKPTFLDGGVKDDGQESNRGSSVQRQESAQAGAPSGN